jgi:outer membrane protein assembly factor BamB
MQALLESFRLTAEQRDRYDAARAETSKRMREIHQSKVDGTMTQDQILKEALAAHKGFNAKVKEILSPEQYAKWEPLREADHRKTAEAHRERDAAAQKKPEEPKKPDPVVPPVPPDQASLSGSRQKEWPQFRGPDGSGVSVETNLPATWGPNVNVAWKTRIPGYGWSCPVVWGNWVFLTTAVSDNQRRPGGGGGGGEPPPDVVFRWEVHCLDRATGKTLWHQVAVERKPTIGTHLSNTYASETPVTDGERVYAYFGMIGLFCYDLSGKLVWSKDLGAYPMQGNWGTSSSPVLDGDGLFVQCDNQQHSFLVALDTKTGKELWRANRSEGSTWSTPVVWRNTVRTEVVLMGNRHVRSYDPATGAVLWELSTAEGAARGVPRGVKAAAGGCKSTPVATREMIYLGMATRVPGQQLGPMWAVKAGARGDITPSAGENVGAFVAWFRTDAGPHFASAVVYDGLLYVFDPHDGVLRCLDAGTGTDVYQEKLPGAHDFKSSPWVQGGTVCGTDVSGTTFVVKAGPHFELLARNDLNEMCWSSPAPAGGALFLRGVEHLYCIRGQPEKGGSAAAPGPG